MRRILGPAILITVALSVLLAGVVLADGLDGKALYDGKCALCHGKDGVAKEMFAKKGMKNLNDAAVQKELTDAVITKTISEGNAEKKMPAYKDKLSADQITAIVKYVRTLAPAK